MTVINSNISALKAQSSLSKNASKLDTAMERLSTGYRINSAKDDAAGLAITNRMTSQINGLNQAVRNANDGLAMISTIEGALAQTTNVMQRMRELAVQAANDSNSTEDRQYLHAEMVQLNNELDRIASQARFNGIRVLDGTFTNKQLQVGANGHETIAFSVDSAAAADIGLFEAEASSFVGVVGTSTAAAAPSYPVYNGTGLTVATPAGPTFPNSDFETTTASVSGSEVTLSGWSVFNQQVELGTTAIGGFTSPTDTSPNPSGFGGQVSGGDGNAPSSSTFSHEFTTAYSASGEYDLRLYSTMTTQAGGDVVHGPYLISKDPVQINAGASISFDWRAVAGADAYDIYAYLLDTDTGASIPLINQTGSSSSDTGWQTVTTSINSSGNYKFVFVSGTFDYSFGQAAGASLLVDNVSISNNDVEPSSSAIDNAVQTSWTSGTLSGTAKNVFEVVAGSGNDAYSAFSGRASYISFGGDGALTAAGMRELVIGTVAAPLDLTQKGSISFDLIKGTDANGGEAPEMGEDLELLYSIDNGATFVSFKTFSADDQSLTSWKSKTIALPEEAQTSNVILKFKQAQSSGASFDTWGLYNISIDAKLTGSSTLPANPIISNTMSISGHLGSTSVLVEAQSSAKDVATSVNRAFSETGVSAEATTKAKLFNLGSAGTIQLDVYGKNSQPQRISATIADRTNLTALAQAFNSFSSITGVTANLSSDKAEVILTNASGEDIGLENFSHNGSSKTLNVIGLRPDGSDDGDVSVTLTADSASDSTRVIGNVSFSSSQSFTVRETSGSSSSNAFIGADVSASTLHSVSEISIATRELAETALGVLDGGLSQIANQRASLGALSSRLEKSIDAVTSSSVNTAAARSRILDTDYAQETSALAKAQIIAQASTAMLAQANQQPQQVLQLLKS
jgi:flagellin